VTIPIYKSKRDSPTSSTLQPAQSAPCVLFHFSQKLLPIPVELHFTDEKTEAQRMIWLNVLQGVGRNGVRNYKPSRSHPSLCFQISIGAIRHSLDKLMPYRDVTQDIHVIKIFFVVVSRVWWYMPVIAVLGRLRQDPVSKNEVSTCSSSEQSVS
jgi:hypothetical protein